MTTPSKPRGFSLAGWNLLVLVLEKLCQDSQQQAYDKQRVVNHEVSYSVRVFMVDSAVLPALSMLPRHASIVELPGQSRRCCLLHHEGIVGLVRVNY